MHEMFFRVAQFLREILIFVCFSVAILQRFVNQTPLLASEAPKLIDHYIQIYRKQIFISSLLTKLPFLEEEY